MSLILSIIALALGPMLYTAFRQSKFVWSSLDGFLFATIAGIVVVHILPEAFDTIGLSAMAFLLFGIAFAYMVDRTSSGSRRHSSKWIILIGALGLVLHAMMDGIALLPLEHLHFAEVEHGHDASGPHGVSWVDGFLGNHIALGVILHRIPVGMAIWWTISPRLGSGIAAATLALVAGATALGYGFGEAVVQVMQTPGLSAFQAFIAGTLLHVIVFSSIRVSAHRADWPQAQFLTGERVGVIAGFFLVFMVPHVH